MRGTDGYEIAHYPLSIPASHAISYYRCQSIHHVYIAKSSTVVKEINGVVTAGCSGVNWFDLNTANYQGPVLLAPPNNDHSVMYHSKAERLVHLSSENIEIRNAKHIRTILHQYPMTADTTNDVASSCCSPFPLTTSYRSTTTAHRRRPTATPRNTNTHTALISLEQKMFDITDNNINDIPSSSSSYNSSTTQQPLMETTATLNESRSTLSSTIQVTPISHSISNNPTTLKSNTPFDIHPYYCHVSSLDRTQLLLRDLSSGDIVQRVFVGGPVQCMKSVQGSIAEGILGCTTADCLHLFSIHQCM
jgi:hypothetical protein